MVKYCNSCGGPLVKGDNFCRQCGARIAEQPLIVTKKEAAKPAAKPTPEELALPRLATPASVKPKGGFFSGLFGGKPAVSPVVLVVKPQKEGFVEEHRKRYLEHRGTLVEQARQEMARPETLAKEALPAASAEALKGLDLSSLSQVSSLRELEKLENIEGLSGLEQSGELSLEALAGLAESETIPKEKGMGCPRCASVKSSIVYCPYCGKGFCSNCASKAIIKGDLIFFECPTCVKEVIVKKMEQKERIASLAR
ncbi:hypothetical protein HY546_01710 [archaeon]|nr:hypothetical protein [archaeon]